MKQQASGLIRYVVGISLFVVLIVFLMQVQKYPMQRYCDNMKKGTTLNEAVKVAKERKFILPKYIEQNDEELVVYNNDWPVLRYGCKMTFDWRKVETAEMFKAK